MQDIVFLGASTGFLEIMELIEDINRAEPRYRVIALLDDNRELHGKRILGVEVKGGLELASAYQDAAFVFGIGSIETLRVRLNIIERLGIEEHRFVTLIHPSAKLYPSAKIGCGCILHYGCVVGIDSILEPFTIMAFHSIVGNYVRVGRGTLITSSVTILGHTQVGKSVFIGSGSCLAEKLSVGDGAVIGMGTVLAKNLKGGEFALGNPGRSIGSATQWLGQNEKFDCTIARKGRNHE